MRTIVGSTKRGPFSGSALPPATMVPPSAWARASAAIMSFTAASSTRGPSASPARSGRRCAPGRTPSRGRPPCGPRRFGATISRRVLVQRWPAVPTAPNTTAGMARARSACAVTTTALLPPSSRIVRPKRAVTSAATRLPIDVDPVNDTSGSRRSERIFEPTDPPGPATSVKSPARWWSAITSLQIRCTAIAERNTGEAGSTPPGRRRRRRSPRSTTTRPPGS